MHIPLIDFWNIIKSSFKSYVTQIFLNINTSWSPDMQHIRFRIKGLQYLSHPLACGNNFWQILSNLGGIHLSDIFVVWFEYHLIV